MAPSPFHGPFAPNSSVFPRHRMAKQQTIEAEQHIAKRKKDGESPKSPNAANANVSQPASAAQWPK